MIELTISHDGKNWIARGDALSAQAASLTQLDCELKEKLRQRGDLQNGEKQDLVMRFDNGALPVWMRQYSQHYFNRTVRIEDM